MPDEWEFGAEFASLERCGLPLRSSAAQSDGYVRQLAWTRSCKI
jgi:hypothetical protein